MAVAVGLRAGARRRGHRGGQRAGAGQAGAGAAAPAAAPGRARCTRRRRRGRRTPAATSPTRRSTPDVLADARRRRPRPRAGAAATTRPTATWPIDRRALPPGQLAAAVVPRRPGRDGRSGARYRVDWLTCGCRAAGASPPDPMPGEDYTGVRRCARWRASGLGGARPDHGARARGGGGGPDQPDGRRRRVGRRQHVGTGDRRPTASRCVAVYIGMLGLDFHVHGPPALVEHLRAVGERYARAVMAARARMTPAARAPRRHRDPRGAAPRTRSVRSRRGSRRRGRTRGHAGARDRVEHGDPGCGAR